MLQHAILCWYACCLDPFKLVGLLHYTVIAGPGCRSSATAMLGPTCPVHALPHAFACSIGKEIGAAQVPGHSEYADAFKTSFMQSWIDANGAWRFFACCREQARQNWWCTFVATSAYHTCHAIQHGASALNLVVWVQVETMS